MAESIEMPFGMWTLVGPRKHVIDGGEHWRNLANMIEPSVCSGNAAFCQTLTALFQNNEKCQLARACTKVFN